MNIIQTTLFGKQKKKLHTNQISVLDDAVSAIVENPEIGEAKKGDLRGVRVYKFKIQKQEYLLAYTESVKQIALIAVGSHENFYRDLKKQGLV